MQRANESRPTWADRLIAWVKENHRGAEVSLVKKMLNRVPVMLAGPNKQSLLALAESGVVVVSGKFPVLAKNKMLQKVYSNGKDAENSKSTSSSKRKS